MHCGRWTGFRVACASARELERVYQELEVELGRAASPEEVTERMGLSVKELDVLMQRMRATSMLSLEEFLPNDKGHEIPLADTLKDTAIDVPRAVESREIRASLIKAVGELPAQERAIISQYYFDGLTLKEIKRALGVSESRVLQVHAQAVSVYGASVRCARTLATVRAILDQAKVPPQAGWRLPSP